MKGRKPEHLTKRINLQPIEQPAENTAENTAEEVAEEEIDFEDLFENMDFSNKEFLLEQIKKIADIYFLSTELHEDIAFKFQHDPAYCLGEILELFHKYNIIK